MDLHPSGFKSSYATGVSGTSQVGSASVTADGPYHAMLWTGTSDSAVDLNPDGFVHSYATGVHGDYQVGYGYDPNAGRFSHALLWNGTAASIVDLNPIGFDWSEALAISSAGQVGRGFGPLTGSNNHALFWNGTAQSAIDLHSFVGDLGPPIIGSAATGISNNGSIVGYGYTRSVEQYAILWTPIPEPTSCCLSACALVIALRCQRTRAIHRARCSLTKIEL
jgi:probable HAF family extracellular repeat protein